MTHQEISKMVEELVRLGCEVDVIAYVVRAAITVRQ